jgi:hypothetical protein
MMRMKLAAAALILCLTFAGTSAFRGDLDVITAATGPGMPIVTTLVLTIGNPVMLVDGMRTMLEAAPLIQNARTLVPVRAVAEALGATVTYDATLRRVDIGRYDVSLALVLGKATATLNGSVVAIDPVDARVVPVIAAGRTMLPLRFVVESLGAVVTYDVTTRVINVVWTH